MDLLGYSLKIEGKKGIVQFIFCWKGFVLETIVKRLKLLTTDELSLRRYLKQLEVLSKLRNLQKITIKTIDNMAITYDLKTDLRYLQGSKEGAEENTKNIIIKMLQELPDLALERIAKIADVPVEYVQDIYDGMKKKK